MRILHYSLGFPPYRRGGLTKYCIDLMKSQAEAGNSVGMFWPGEMGVVFSKKTRIIKHKDYVSESTHMVNFELQGSLPVSLLEGVCDPNIYMQEKESSEFENFLRKYKPEVIHFHTLMGFPSIFFDVIKKFHIKTVFTTHDYFGICPKTTLIKKGRICTNTNQCAECNLSAMSEKKIRILQSYLYRQLKDSLIIQQLRTKHLSVSEQTYDLSIEDIETEFEDTNELFKKLREYYFTMLRKMDVVHCNSKNTCEIYKTYASLINTEVLTISHKDIFDNRRKKTVNAQVRFAYLGPKTQHKGYSFLLKICEKLWNQGYKFKLSVYFHTQNRFPFLEVNPPYSYSELSKVMDTSDCVIVPSLWCETFGFIVAEALSYGVPVLVSQNVGAKDLVDEGKNGQVFQISEIELLEILKKLIINPDNLRIFNDNICSEYRPKTMKQHSTEMLGLYDEIISGNI